MPETVTVVLPSVEPLVGETPDIVGAVGEETVRENPALDAAAFESCTWALNINVPAAVGVPEMVPVGALSCRPAGRVPPFMLQV